MSPTATQNYEGERVSTGDATVTVGAKIDSGKEGTVYHVSDNEDIVLKIFNQDRRAQKEEKVRAMVANKPQNTARSSRLNQSIIWPQNVVWSEENREFLGYQMPYKNLDTAKNAFEYTLTQLDWDSSDSKERFTIAYNLAVMVATIHSEGHAIGDFNHDNILIDQDGFVTLIDCDAFHISDGSSIYPGDTWYPQYSPPEGRPTTDDVEAVKQADRFCLGVHIFQFLMEGYHPYHAQGTKAVNGDREKMIQKNKCPYVYNEYEPIEDAPSFNEIPTPIRELFKQCFSESAKNKSSNDLLDNNNRPTASRWTQVLGEYIDHAGESNEDVEDELNHQEGGVTNQDQSTSTDQKQNNGNDSDPKEEFEEHVDYEKIYDTDPPQEMSIESIVGAISEKVLFYALPLLLGLLLSAAIIAILFIAT